MKIIAMFIMISFIPAVVVVAESPSKAPRPIAIFKVDFEDAKDSVARTILRHQRVSHAPKGGHGGTSGIRVAYAGSKRGSDRVVMQFKLARPVKEASLCFDVLFEEDFQFVKGGKLHGLGPANPAVGGEKVKPETWSSRLMFHRGGGLKTYHYHQKMSQEYGEGTVVSDFTFQKNRFYRLTWHVRLNEPASATNGFAHLFVDGKRVTENDNLQFRAKDGPHTLIRRFLFSTFHGGSSGRYAPKKPDGTFATVYARFDNFAVYPGLVVRTREMQKQEER